MKKVILTSIFLFSIFAIQNTYADCYYNYPYNGQYVTYCYGDNSNSNNTYYNSNGGYYYNNGSYDYNYNNSSNYTLDKTSEDNYYNLLYMNGISTGGSVTQSKTDFFKDNVIGTDKEFDKLDSLYIKTVSFSSATYNSKYSSSKTFLTQLKELVKSKYTNGEIDYDGINDVINDLDYLVYNLNEQFSNYRKYEYSKNNMYKEMADDNATQVRTSYSKLKFTLSNL